MIPNILSPAAALKVVNASKVASTAMNVGFTGQQLLGIADSYPRFIDAMHAGDTDTALELATGAALSGTMAGLSSAHLLRTAFGEKYRPTFTADQAAIGRQDSARNMAAHDINDLNVKFGKLKDTHADEISHPLQIYKENGGNLDQIKEKMELVKAIDPKILPDDEKAKQLEYYQKALGLSDRTIELGNHLTDTEYPRLAELLTQAGKLHTDADLDRNYLGSREYSFDNENDLNSQLNAIGMRKPAFLKRRVFTDRVDALENGFVPKDINVFDMYQKYRDGVARVLGTHDVQGVLEKSRDANNNPVAVNGFRHLPQWW